MDSINDHYNSIVAELVRLASPDPEFKCRPSFPGLIAAGEFGSILTSDKMETAIAGVATWLFNKEPENRSRYTKKEWNALVRKAFGPAIAATDLNTQDSAELLRTLVETALNENPATVDSQFITIGCTLFYTPITEPLCIGPVTFAPKMQWLTSFGTIAQIDEKHRLELEKACTGEIISSSDDDLKRSISDVLRDSQLACTVETKGLAPDLAENRAIIAARLAQTAIALLWRLPSSVLGGFHLSVQPGCREIQTISFRSGEVAAGRWRLVGMPTGPSLTPDAINTLFSEANDLLDLAGKMISTWTSVDAYQNASASLKNLAQSIFFFWEGCNDSDHLMSIVKFTAALEALVKGEKHGIKCLIKARLNLLENDTLIGNQTVKKFVDRIYSDGRSCTLHGTNKDLLHDWSIARTGAESLTRHCLVACMKAYLDNPQIECFKS
jgi:hypothetical protein